MRWIILFLGFCILIGALLGIRHSRADDQVAGRIVRTGDITTYFAPDGSIIAIEASGVLTVYSPDGAVLGRIVITQEKDPEDYEPPLPFGDAR